MENLLNLRGVVDDDGGVDDDVDKMLQNEQIVSCRRCCQYTNYVIPPDNGYNITDDLLDEVWLGKWWCCAGGGDSAGDHEEL